MVIEKGTIRKLQYGFLFAFHINYDRIYSHFDTIHERDSQPAMHPGTALRQGQQRAANMVRLTGAAEVLAADDVRDVGDGVLRQTDVGIHLHWLGISPPVKHEIFCRVRVCIIYTTAALRKLNSFRLDTLDVEPLFLERGIFKSHLCKYKYRHCDKKLACLQVLSAQRTTIDNKNLAIANRSRVSCAHDTLRASIGINITPWPWNLG